MDELNFTIAKITHEMRNPLTLIHSSLQLIQSTHPEVHDFQFWDQTMQDVDYLTQLLEDLSSYTDDRRFFNAIQMGGGAQRAHKIEDIVPFLHTGEELSGLAHHLEDDGHGARFPIIIRNGKGDTLPMLVHPEDDELAR